MEPTISNATAPAAGASAEPVLRIDGLGKRYGEFEALHDLSLSVARGEIFALLGPNGAGKTTTIRMLMGILKATAGSASVEGLDCFAQRVEVKRRVGYLPDEPVYYDYLRGGEILRFVAEMHGLPADVAQARTSTLLKRLDLEDATEEYAVNYSKGMKKKLAMICALLHEPSLLILDEPTNGLDPIATRTLHELVRELAAQGRTIFYSTHLLDQAQRLCHRIGILYKGRLAAAGTLDELRGNLSSESSLEDVFFAVTGARAQTDLANGAAAEPAVPPASAPPPHGPA